MPKEIYGLVEDMDKFIETEGAEGIIPAVEKPIVEAPIVEAPIVEVPIVEAPIVEKPIAQTAYNIEEDEAYQALLTKNKELEDKLKSEVLNPKLKEIQDWANRTNRPIEDYTKFQDDPKDLADLDVVRKIQQLKNPELSKEELDFYIKDNFISDVDLDTDEDIMRKNIRLKKEVSSGRKTLEEQRLVFNTVQDSTLTADQQEAINFAAKVKADNELSHKTRIKESEALKAVISKTDKISFELAEGKSIDFTIPAESIKGQQQYLTEMKRWENEDGSTNQQIMLEDSYKIRHFDEIVKLAHQQGMNDQVELTAEQNANIVQPARQHKTVSEGKFGFVGRTQGKRKQV